MDKKTLLSTLKNWFAAEKRDFPWRRTPAPYAVWISEVMLQQTQAQVVVSYFERWMQRFPTIAALAAADLDEVIKQWEGLGYYSRARNLHEGAKFLCRHYGGKLPACADALKNIKGLGPYTISAILSFAYHQKAACVDGNVLRVASRFFCIADDVSKPKTILQIRSLIESFLPDKEPWVVSEALIELGAAICKKKPACLACPLKTGCRAYLEGKEAELPFKAKKTLVQALFRQVAVIYSDGHFLLKKERKGTIMSDLHEFPYVEAESIAWTEVEFLKQIEEKLRLSLQFKKGLPDVRHSFTRYRALLRSAFFSAAAPLSIEGYLWVPKAQLNRLAFSSGHKRILIEALKEIS